jgi:putative aminopeptidase FrvX
MQISDSEVLSLLTDLDGVTGVSGFEGAVGDKIAGYMKDYTDISARDALGNRIFIKKGKNADFKLMLSAHMDQIGFIVRDIDDDGYIYFLPVGMHDPRLLVNQVMTIYTKKGEIPGVIGAKPVHQNKGAAEVLTISDLKIDIGAISRAETEDMGVAVGDVIVNSRGCRTLNNKLFSGTAVDNRSGCAAMILAMNLLDGVKTDATVYCCASVQEEVGIRGAKVAAASIKPDVALCVDVCFASTDDSIAPNNNRVFQGKGPAIQLYDWNPDTFLGNITSIKMKDALVHAAGSSGVPYQLITVLYSGTDAAEMSLSNSGVLTGGIGIPNRYMHSALGTVHIDDVRGAAMLIAEYIKELRP